MNSQPVATHKYLFNIKTDEHLLKVFDEMLDKEPRVGTPITELINIELPLTELIESVKEWANIFGFDVGERVPLIKDITFIEKDDFLSKVPKARIHADTMASADLISNTIQIFKFDDTNTFRLLETISHELIHLCSHRVINVEVKENKYIFTEGTRGYWNGKDTRYRYFSEALTELSNVYIISELWHKNGIHIDIPVPRYISYEGYIILLIALIYEASLRNKTNAQIIFMEMEKGLISGNYENVGKLLSVFDQNIMNELLTETCTNIDEDFLEKYANSLQLTHLVNYIDKIKAEKTPFRYIWDNFPF